MSGTSIIIDGPVAGSSSVLESKMNSNRHIDPGVPVGKGIFLMVRQC
jgi:hypothetical protein